MARRQLTAADVEFTIRCEPEDIPYVGNCSAIDAKTDRRAENWIRKQLEQGNEWAWCCVCVIATWNDFEGKAYLGGCSYRSESDFCQPGGYYEDLKQEALSDLNCEIERVGIALDELEESAA